MALVLTMPGVVGAIVFVVAPALGAWVYFARPDRFQNRVLAAALVVEGIYVGAGSGLTSLTDDPGMARALYALNAVAGVAGLPAFLLLLSTIDSPLGRPFRPRPVRLALVAFAVATFALYFAAPELYLIGVAPGDAAPWRGVDGPVADVAVFVALGIFAASLLAAIDAHRRASPGTVARDHARAYLVAFAVRDGTYVCTISIGWFLGNLPILQYVVPLVSLAFVTLLAIGILRTQLFDIDLKIKATLARSIVAGAFFLVFFATSEIAEALVEGIAGPVVGLVAALVLAIALRPIERAADRVASVAMPGVSASREYVLARKHAVYRAALEAMGPHPSPEEREILQELRASLGVEGEPA